MTYDSINTPVDMRARVEDAEDEDDATAILSPVSINTINYIPALIAPNMNVRHTNKRRRGETESEENEDDEQDVTAASASKRGRTEEDVPVLTQHAAHFQQLQHPHPQVGALIHMWNMLPRLSPLQVNFLTALHIQVARYTQLAGERDRILSGNYNKDDPATSLPMTFAPPPFPELHTFWYHNDLATAVWSGVDNSLFHPIWPAPTPGLPWHIWVNTELGFLLNWTKGEEHMRHLAKMLVDDAANSRLAPEPTPWG